MECADARTTSGRSGSLAGLLLASTAIVTLAMAMPASAQETQVAQADTKAVKKLLGL